MSLGSNAIILRQSLGLSLPVIHRLLNTDVRYLNPRERAMRDTLEKRLDRRPNSFSAEAKEAVISMPSPPQQPPSLSDRDVATLVKHAGFTLHNSLPDERPGKEK